jgi:hypothetical protein
MEKVIAPELSMSKIENNKEEEPINDNVEELPKEPPQDQLQEQPKEDSNEWPSSQPLNQVEKETAHQPTIQPTTIHDEEEK